MLLRDALIALQPYMRGLAGVAFQHHFLAAVRSFCYDTRIVMRRVSAAMENGATAFIAAPEGSEILGLISAQSSVRGPLNVGLMQGVMNTAAPGSLLSYEGRTVTLPAPVSMPETIDATITIMPAFDTPYIPDELIAGKWREAIVAATQLQLANDLSVQAFPPQEIQLLTRRLQGFVSNARIEASNMGQQKLQTVPFVDLDGLSAPPVISAPQAELTIPMDDLGNVVDPLAGVADFGGLS